MSQKVPCVYEALSATANTLKALTKGNKEVQELVFTQMDSLLAIQGLEAPLCGALTEVRCEKNIVN